MIWENMERKADFEVKVKWDLIQVGRHSLEFSQVINVQASGHHPEHKNGGLMWWNRWDSERGECIQEGKKKEREYI